MEEKAGGRDRTINELIRLLGDPDANVRSQARHQLCARAQEAIPRLVEGLESAYENIRFEISRALAEMGEIAIEPMLKAILHPDVQVRAAAARVLSLIGTEDALRRLDEAAMTEKRKTVRKELREASAKIARKLETRQLKQVPPEEKKTAEAPDEKELKPKEQEDRRVYLSIVKNLIISNWAKPQLFPAEPEGEEVLVTLKVDPDGTVSRVLIENKWQNTPLGESLKDAIRRSSPLPPVPEIVARGKNEIDLTFILPAPR